MCEFLCLVSAQNETGKKIIGFNTLLTLLTKLILFESFKKASSRMKCIKL